MLAVEISLSGGLQDQAIGQQDVVFALQPSGSLAILANEGGGLGFEVVQRHALNTEGRPCLRRRWLEVLANPCNHIPPRANGAAVQKLQFGVFGSAVRALAFGTDPEPVYIAPDPSRGIPGQRAAFVGILILKLIQQEEAVDTAIVNLMTAQWGKC